MFESLFGGKKKSIVGVDIGSAFVKIVQIDEKSGQRILKTYGEIALGPYHEKAVGELARNDVSKTVEALQFVLKESNADTRDVVVSFPASGTLVFTITLPLSALDSLEDVVPNEARKYIPTALTEVTLNWIVIPEHVSRMDKGIQEGDLTERDILVIAIRNDLFQEYQSVVAQLGVTAHNYEAEFFSGIRASYDRELSPTAMIDCGASGYRIIIMHHGIVRMMHTINRGGFFMTQQLAQGLEVSFADAEKLKREQGLTGGNEKVTTRMNTLTTAIVEEIKQALFQYEKQHNKGIDSIVLVGGGAKLKGFAEKLSQETMITIRYSDSFSLVQKPAFLDGVLEQSGPDFAVAIGVGLSYFE